MDINNGLHVSRKSLLLMSLLVVLLISALFVYVSMMDCSNGASLENAVHVKNETELRTAIKNAPSGTSIVIALDNDIVFTDFTRLRISANTDITLTSNRAMGYYKILRYITVESDGVLRLDGVIITNEPAGGAGGVSVARGGLLVMYRGEISGNAIAGSLDPFTHAYGGGVCNFGVFEMYSGKISGNKAIDGEGVGDIFMGNFVGYGGGVANYGTFKMFGGEISGNTARYGGGVYNLGEGVFEMSGGEICNNQASSRGGGVYNNGAFSWSGGIISGNTASKYNDVYPADSSGSSNGSESSNDGNGGGSGSNGSESSNDGNNSGSSIGDGFSLRDMVIMCGGVAILLVVIIGVVLLFASKKEIKIMEKMQSNVYS